MRIAVAGKGGSGKTTISGTLARALAADGHRVLAVDADPNPNLALTLGVAREQYDDIRALPHGLLEHRDVEGTRTAVLTRPIDDVIGEFATQTPSGIQLLAMGPPRSAGGG